MKRFITPLLLVALIGIVANPLIVSGQENPDTLLAISDDENLTEEERFIKAKDGLVLALTLAVQKVHEFTVTLEEQTFDEESTENNLRVPFIETLSSYDSYYLGVLVLSEELTTLDEVKALAQEVKTYRSEIYTPGIEEIVRFILVFYTENVVGIANERFERISEDINTLESRGLIEKGIFTEQTDTISVLLADAYNLNLQAKDILLDVPSPDSTTTEEVADTHPEDGDPLSPTTTSDVDDANSEPQQEELQGEKDEVRTLIEGSLNNVKTVYGLFLEISNSVREILGL